MSGAGLAADSLGNIYFLDANGDFDTNLNASGFPSKGDLGNAFINSLPRRDTTQSQSLIVVSMHEKSPHVTSFVSFGTVFGTPSPPGIAAIVWTYFWP
jgi:hypothetical protein